MASPPTSTPWVPMWPNVPGAAATSLTYKGDWVAGTYQDGDVVVRNGVAFMCLGGPTTDTPDTAPWGLANTVASYGTSLPASPVDGQEAILVDSLTAPTYQWRFRYNAGNTTAYKWEFIGGAPWVGSSNTTEAAAAIQIWYQFPGISFPAPLAGVYDIRASAKISVGASADIIYISPSVAAVPKFGVSQSLNGANDTAFITAEARVTAAAGNALSGAYFIQYQIGGSRLSERTVTITPVRVS